MTCLQDVNMSELQSNTEYTISFTEEDVSRLKAFAAVFKYKSFGETINNLLFPRMGFNDGPFDLAKRAIAMIAPDINLLENTRRIEVVTYRIIVAEYLRNRGLTLSEIGRCLDKDHSTIVYYLNTAETAILHPKIYKLLHEKRSAFYTVMLQFQKLIKRK